MDLSPTPSAAPRGRASPDSVELDRARCARAEKALAAAYELARAGGYRPGSAEMQALDRADADFRHAQQRWRPHPPDQAVVASQALPVDPRPADPGHR